MITEVVEAKSADDLCVHWFVECFTETAAAQKRYLWERDCGKQSELSWDKEEEPRFPKR